MANGNASSPEDATAAKLGAWWDLVAALLLGLATVGSSVSIYLSAWWDSLESRRLSESNAMRSESVRADNVAAAQSQVDVSIFVEILSSRARGDQHHAEYLERRVRDEFRPALQKWDRLASADDGGVDSQPATPFKLREYRVAAREQADRLRDRANEILAEAHHANNIGTAYVMPTILFSAVLFLAGIATKLRPPAARATLIMASVVFVASTITVILVPRMA